MMAKGKNQVGIATFVVILLFLSAPCFAGQVEGCTPRELTVSLRPPDPEYADAMNLKQTLEAHGIVVRCVLRSKMSGMFVGQKGAALYRTDDGAFDVLFLPKPLTWAALQIIRSEKNGRYSYSFRGWPKRTGIMYGRSYFVKHVSGMCIASDERLSARLDRILNSS